MGENMEEKMGTNAVLGKGPVNRKMEYVETRIDAENARKEAFGGSEDDELKLLEYEQRNASMNVIRKEGEKMIAKTEFSKKLIIQISEESNIAKEYIKIYKATGTVLDKFHKISAWIEIAESKVRNGRIIITLDIFTEDKNKRKSADINFRKPQCGFNPGDNNSEEYQATIKDITTEVRKKFEEKRKLIGESPKQQNYPHNKKKEKTDWTNLKGKKVVNFKNHK